PNPAERLAPLQRLDEEVDMAGRLGVEATQPDRVHLELGRQQIADLAGLLIATLGEVLHVFSPLRGSRPATRAASPKVTVSAIQPLIIGRRPTKCNGTAERNMGTRQHGWTRVNVANENGSVGLRRPG